MFESVEKDLMREVVFEIILNDGFWDIILGGLKRDWMLYECYLGKRNIEKIKLGKYEFCLNKSYCVCVWREIEGDRIGKIGGGFIVKGIRDKKRIWVLCIR